MQSDGAIVRRYLERVWGAGDVASLGELTAERMSVWTPALRPRAGGLLAGRVASLPGEATPRELDRAALAAVVTAWHETFSTLQVVVEDLIAEGGRVAARVAWQGEHMETRGIAAQRVEQRWPSFEFFRLEAGRIVEIWSSVAMYEWP